MNVHRTRKFIDRFIFLLTPDDEIVIDFIRQAELGECPVLVLGGPQGTGKTRLGVVLLEVVERLIVVETLPGNTIDPDMEQALLPFHRPVVIIANDPAQFTALDFAPRIWMRRILRGALVMAGVELDVSDGEIREAAGAIKLR